MLFHRAVQQQLCHAEAQSLVKRSQMLSFPSVNHMTRQTLAGIHNHNPRWIFAELVHKLSKRCSGHTQDLQPR